MPNTEAAGEEQSLVVQSKKWKQEGTFRCTRLSTEASRAFPPPRFIVLDVLLTPGTALESCQRELSPQSLDSSSELAKSLVAC